MDWLRSASRCVVCVGTLVLLLMNAGCPFGPSPEDEPELEFREEVPFHKMPDLSVVSLSADPARANPGDRVAVEVTIANLGRVTSGTADLIVSVDDVEILRQSVGPLDGNEESAVGAVWTATSTGRFTVLTRLEVDEDALEPAIDNNTQTALIRVSGAETPAPELEVDIATTQGGVSDKGNSHTVTLLLRNPSFDAVADIPFRVYRDDELVTDANIESLAAGESAEYQFPWDNPSPGEHVLEFVADLPDHYPYRIAQKAKSWRVSVPEATTEYPVPSMHHWSCLGPSILTGGLAGLTEQSVGRMDSIAIDPKNQNILFSGSPSGGIWKSTNAGASWFPVGDKLHDLRATSLRFDPKNSQIIYCTTGWWAAKASEPLAPIFKSIDGGTTWHTFCAGPAQGGTTLEVRYTNAGMLVIYVGTNQGVYRYINANPSLTSSALSGWSRIKTGNVRDLVVHPTNPDLLYASVAWSGLWRTKTGTSATDDSSWFKLTNGLPCQDMCIDMFAADTKVLYAVDRVPGQVNVYRTPDGGDGWHYQFSRADTGAGNDCQYNPFARIHPTQEVVYFGGGRLYKAEKYGGVWVQSEVTGLHVDQKMLEFDPHNPNQYYATNDGGIYRGQTNFGGKDTCIPRNTDLRTTQFYDIDVSPSNANMMIGGNQDNNTILYTGTPTWQNIRLGDGNFCLIATSDNKVMYSQTQYLRDTLRSDDGGKTWPHNASVGLPTGSGWGPGLGGNNRAYITVNPNDSTGMSLLSQGDQVYATSNGGVKWHPVGPSLTKPNSITRVLVQPGTTTVIAGDALGQLWQRLLLAWYKLVPAHPTKARIMGMAFAPTNPKVLYVIYDTPTLFNLVDRIHRFEEQPNGAWTDTNITANFPWTHLYLAGGQVQLGPMVKLMSVCGDGYDDETVYVGTDKGVMRGKYDSSSSQWKWAPYNGGMPFVPVVDIVVDPTSKELRAATWGRGAWSVVTGP